MRYFDKRHREPIGASVRPLERKPRAKTAKSAKTGYLGVLERRRAVFWKERIKLPPTRTRTHNKDVFLALPVRGSKFVFGPNTNLARAREKTPWMARARKTFLADLRARIFFWPKNEF